MVVYFRPHLENLTDPHSPENNEESGKRYIELCMNWIKENFPEYEIIIDTTSTRLSEVWDENGDTEYYLTLYLQDGLERIYNNFEWMV